MRPNSKKLYMFKISINQIAAFLLSIFTLVMFIVIQAVFHRLKTFEAFVSRCDVMSTKQNLKLSQLHTLNEASSRFRMQTKPSSKNNCPKKILIRNLS